MYIYNDDLVGKWEAFSFNFLLIRGRLQLTGEKWIAQWLLK